jgi:hypothetical protein
MAKFFDEAEWRRAIAKSDWYIRLYPTLKNLKEQWEAESDRDKAIAMKKEVRNFFETALQSKKVVLGNNGPDLDAERQSIDTIIIHHTSSQPGYSLPYMNAVQMLNVYVPYFVSPTDDRERSLQGQPLWSDHIREGRPVFYLYHWLMRMDGSFEHLLEDNELGWHAANRDINRRSIAICLDNDYEKIDPEPEVLQKLADFITQQYPQVAADRVFGHKEVSRHKTICPGGNFVDDWKKNLLENIQST